MSVMRKIGVYYNSDKIQSDVAARQCVDFLRERNLDVLMTKEQVRALGISKVTSCTENAFFSQPDCIIILGGDGTLLGVARKTAKYHIPLCGINFGKLGFLTNGEADGLEGLLSQLCEGQTVLEERMMLNCTICFSDGRSASFLCLNDILVKNTGMRMIELTASSDEETVDVFRADGVIVATPTGSTAYSLAAGGPVVMPGAEVMLLNPICPHRLQDRAYVIAPDRTIRLSFPENAGEMIACIDGQESMAITGKDVVEIRKSEHQTVLIRPKGFSFFERLRHKLCFEI